MSDKCKCGICDGYHSWPCKGKDEGQQTGGEDLKCEIKSLKDEIEWLKTIVDHQEKALCDCSYFADYGEHGDNCRVTRLDKELVKE